MTSSTLIPVHMTLCGKGGVGKSVVARLLAEYLTDQGTPPLAVDTDPVNASFAAVNAFDVNRIDLIDEDNKINARRFDEMVIGIVESGRPAVIDTGASSYIALLNYMRELDLAATFRAEGHELFLHVLIAGGPSLPFTIEILDDVCTSFGGRAGIMVWLNHFWERIDISGKPFLDWRVYREHEQAIQAVLEIQRMASDTSAEDFIQLLKTNRSFAEAVASDSVFNILTRARLRRIREMLFASMDAALGARLLEQSEGKREITA